MYKIRLIKNNGFESNWTTLLIGRQFNLISASEVTNYAVDVLENNPNLDNELILELALEQTEENIDSLLEKITANSSLDDQNKEFHKWLYCTLKEEYNNSTNENIFEKIEDIFSIFKNPQIMYDFFRNVSDAFYYPEESNHTINDLVEKFLNAEKQFILMI